MRVEDRKSTFGAVSEGLSQIFLQPAKVLLIFSQTFTAALAVVWGVVNSANAFIMLTCWYRPDCSTESFRWNPLGESDLFSDLKLGCMCLYMVALSILAMSSPFVFAWGLAEHYDGWEFCEKRYEYKDGKLSFCRQKEYRAFFQPFYDVFKGADEDLAYTIPAEDHAPYGRPFITSHHIAQKQYKRSPSFVMRVVDDVGPDR